MEKPNIKVEEVGIGYIFASMSVKGKTVRFFIHPSQMEYFAKMDERIRRVERQQLRDNAVAQGILDNLGISTKNSYTPMALLGMALSNAKIVLDGQTTFGYELDSVTGYIKKIAKLDGVLTELPEYPQFMHVVDEALEFDEDKYNESQVVL